MLFFKKKSEFLANEIAAKYNGTIERCNVMFDSFKTCYYKVKLRYKNMRVEVYPFLPYSHIWIQNFGLKQNINFSVGKALPTFGLDTPFKDLFSNKSILLFSHNAYDIDATKSFCQKIGNEIDIIDLQLGEKEYLCISSGQIVLQSKNKKIDGLANRIDALSNLFDRYVQI